MSNDEQVDRTKKSNLKQLRETLGITQTDLVIHAGMSMATLSMIESKDYYPPKEDTRKRLLDALSKFANREIVEADVWTEYES